MLGETAVGEDCKVTVEVADTGGEGTIGEVGCATKKSSLDTIVSKIDNSLGCVSIAPVDKLVAVRFSVVGEWSKVRLAWKSISIPGMGMAKSKPSWGVSILNFGVTRKLACRVNVVAEADGVAKVSEFEAFTVETGGRNAWLVETSL